MAMAKQKDAMDKKLLSFGIRLKSIAMKRNMDYLR
jgi:hypothetical protein